MNSYPDPIKGLVSIIVACRNGESYVDDCLQSLLNLEYKNIEIIICDDASTDNTLGLLTSWANKNSNIILLSNARNEHQASARNYCMSIARGEYFMIQDIDDISAPNRIDVLLRELILNNVDFVSSSMGTIDGSGHINLKPILRFDKKFPIASDFLWNLPFNHPATLFKASVIRKFGGYRISKETKRNEDYDLFMRLYASGVKGMNVNETLYIYRLDINTYKRRNFSSRISECIVRYKGFRLLGVPFYSYLFVLKPLLAHIFTKITILSNFK